MKRITVLIGAGLLLLFSTCASPEGALVHARHLWFRPVAGAGEWQREMPRRMGEYWLKTEIEIRDTIPAFQPHGLLISMLASSEVYWDGHLIGYNGRVGSNKATEQPGRYLAILLIPDTLLRTGVHEVLIRFSNFHSRNKFRIYTIAVEPYWSMARDPVVRVSFVHIYAGFFLLIGLYFVARYLLRVNRRANLLFAGIALAFFGLILLEHVKFYYYYPYPWHFTRVRVILAITVLISVLLPMYFSTVYGFGGQRRISMGLLLFSFFLISIGIPLSGYDPVTMVVMFAGFAVSLFLVARAYHRGYRGSGLTLVGLLPIPLSVGWWFPHYDYIIFIGFGHLVLMMLISLAVQERDEQRARVRAQLLSSRLELELLKKQIQPHFLMNSLTSAIEWIEQHPRRGVELLYALVKEFDIVLDIADKKLIPIEQELDLCRAHVAIMSFRREKNYLLEVDDIPPGEKIPPAVLHTLIENGISHNGLRQREIRFKIQFRQGPNWREYRVFTETDAVRSATAPKEGTGLKYIKARLEESFPGRWISSSGPAPGGWETIIRIMD